MNDPIAYGPTGIRCGCGKDAHSNLTPCRLDEETAAAVASQGRPRTMLDRAREALNARMTKDDLRLVLENVITHADALKDRVAELEAERHTTNEALTDAAETLRANRDRIAELEKVAVEARAALGSLCYDLEDPGTAALDALCLLTQATVWTETGPDFAAETLARHDAQIMRRCAEFVRDTYTGKWADDAAATLERDADITERGCPGFEKEYQGVSDAKRRLANCKHCGKPWTAHAKETQS